MKDLFLCGAGNPEGIRLATRINEHEHRWNRIVILDDDPAKQGQSILGVKVEGPFSHLEKVDPSRAQVQNLVAKTALRRARAATYIERFGIEWAQLISPDVDILGVILAQNTIIFQQVILGTGAKIGSGTVVLMGAIMGHGCSLGEGSIVAPRAVVNARVRISDHVYVGTNSSIMPDLTVGSWATVGAGTIVTENVAEEATVFGVPAEVVFSENAEKRALMRGEIGAKADDENIVQPGSRKERNVALENLISGIWKSILNNRDLGIDDNFFDSGAHSLAATQALQLLHVKCSKNVKITDIYEYPTVRNLAEYVDILVTPRTEQAAGMQSTRKQQMADARGKKRRQVGRL